MHRVAIIDKIMELHTTSVLCLNCLDKPNPQSPVSPNPLKGAGKAIRCHLCTSCVLKNTGTFLQNVLFYSAEMQTAPKLFNILTELSHPEEMFFK